MIIKIFLSLCLTFIPIVKSQQLYIVQEPWFPTISNVNFCLVKNNIDVHIPLINTVFQNVNMFLTNNDDQPLYFNFYENADINCDFFINLISNSTMSYNNAANCKRKYLCVGGACYNQGCNITINVCALQTAASFYNVLLHEVLHAIGLEHPNPIINNSIMSYITYININKSSVYDNIYRLIADIDIYNIKYILYRDFSSSYTQNNKQQTTPLYSAQLHVSGLKNYIINYNNNIITPCLIKLNLKPLLNPSLMPSLKPSLIRSLKPSLMPSLKPSLKPSLIKLNLKPSLMPSLKPPLIKLNLKPPLKPSLKPSLRNLIDNLNWFNVENTITPDIDIDTSENAYINIKNNILPNINIKQKPAVFTMDNNIKPNINIGG